MIKPAIARVAAITHHANPGIVIGRAVPGTTEYELDITRAQLIRPLSEHISGTFS
jgi:hypothetical protein